MATDFVAWVGTVWANSGGSHRNRLDPLRFFVAPTVNSMIYLIKLRWASPNASQPSTWASTTWASLGLTGALSSWLSENVAISVLLDMDFLLLDAYHPKRGDKI